MAQLHVNVQTFPSSEVSKDESTVFIREGSYAVVTFGWLSCFNTKIPVAIKDYKQGFGEDVVKEISILSRLAHDNVIRLLGIIKDELEFPKLLLDFMTNETLLGYTKQHKNSLPEKDALKLLLGITRGMTYIHDSGIIHRDLACRNILLGNSYSAKISDFGFSVQFEPQDSNKMHMFQPDEISRIPYRWMPAEAVSGLLTNSKSSGFYSKSTDVWSFAVIIYEMYSPVSPYESIKISGKSIPEAIAAGNDPTTISPTKAPSSLAEVMYDVFNKSIVTRPTFPKLRTRIEKLLKEETEETLSFAFKVPQVPAKYVSGIQFSDSTHSITNFPPANSVESNKYAFEANFQTRMQTFFPCPSSGHCSNDKVDIKNCNFQPQIQPICSGIEESTLTSLESGYDSRSLDFEFENDTWEKDAVIISNLIEYREKNLLNPSNTNNVDLLTRKASDMTVDEEDDEGFRTDDTFVIEGMMDTGNNEQDKQFIQKVLDKHKCPMSVVHSRRFQSKDKSSPSLKVKLKAKEDKSKLNFKSVRNRTLMVLKSSAIFESNRRLTVTEYNPGAHSEETSS